jgi:UDP-glucose 4-epimerase
MPIAESCPKGVCTNPYGWTKLWIDTNRFMTDLDQRAAGLAGGRCCAILTPSARIQAG